MSSRPSRLVPKGQPGGPAISLQALTRRSRALEIAAQRSNIDLTLGDPPPHRSALAEFASRPAPPEPTISIAPRAEWLARRDKAAASPEERRECDEEADGEAKRRREYEKTRKRRWRAGRKAATLHDATARFAARA